MSAKNVETKWYGKENQKIYEDAIEVGLETCAIDLQGQAKILIKQYPAIDTGRLWKSINYKTSRTQLRGNEDDLDTIPNSFEAIVGTVVEYAPHVEYGTTKMRPRPFLRLALAMRQEILGIIFTKNVIKYVAENSKVK